MGDKLGVGGEVDETTLLSHVYLHILEACGLGVVDRPGFEPGTSRLPTERSSRLSYRPNHEDRVVDRGF